MPFKSKAQRRKFAQLLVEGKISDETYEEWNRLTGRKALPERVTKKPERVTKQQAKTTRRARATSASTGKTRAGGSRRKVSTR